MSNEIGSLIVRIGADVDDLLKGTKKSETALENLAAVGVKAGFAVATAAVAAASAVAGLALKGIELGDSLAKAAERINVTATELAGMRYAASLANIEAGTLDDALVKLAKSTSEAAIGSKAQADAFRELGLSAEDIRKLPLTEQMLKVGDALEGVTNQTDKLRISSEIFGRGAGAQMLNLFKQGSAAIQEQLAEAQKLGLYLDGTQTRVVQEAADAQTKMKEAFKGLAIQLGAYYAPAIKGAAEAVANITATVTKSLPYLQALDERFLGIAYAANSLGDSSLKAVLLEDIKAMDTLNNRIADQQKLLAMAGGPANEQILNDLLKDQGDLQKRINDLLAERVKRQADADGGGNTPQSPSVDTEWMSNLQKALKPAQDEITKTEEMLYGLFKDIREQEEKSATDTETLLQGVFQSIRDQENTTATETERVIQETFAAVQKQTADRYQELVGRYMSERELEQAKYEQDLKDLTDAEAARVATVDQINSEREKVEAEHQQRLVDIKTREKRQSINLTETEWYSNLSAVTTAAAAIVKVQGDHSKRSFEIQKKLATASAIVSMAGAIAKANDMPFPANIAAMAIAAANGLTQLQAIRSATYEGGAPSASATSSGSAASAGAAAPAAPNQIITVRGVDANQLFTGRQLVSVLQAAIKDGAKLVIQP